MLLLSYSIDVFKIELSSTKNQYYVFQKFIGALNIPTPLTIPMAAVHCPSNEVPLDFFLGAGHDGGK